MAALAAAAPTAHNDDDDDDMAARAAAAPTAATDLNDDDADDYEDDFVDPEDYTDDDFQSIDTADEEPDYDPKLPEVADAKLPVPRRPRRVPVAAAAPVPAPVPAPEPVPAPVPAPEPVPAPAPAPAVTNYDKWNNIGDEEQGPPPSPVDHAGALPAMRVSERDDGGISFDFTTMQPEANDDLVTLNPLGGDDVDENEKPGIYRRATPN